MKDTLNTPDLATLLKRGLELNVWFVPEENKLGKKDGLFGAVVYNPTELSPDELDMDKCSYAPTIIEAINLAVKKEI